MRFFIASAICFLSLNAWSATGTSKPGSQCGLTDYWGGPDDQNGPEWKFDDGQSIELTNLKPSQILSLPIITQRQLMAAAEGEGRINPIKAVEWLTTGSDGGEAYVEQFTFKGELYDAVIHYPGDNPYGVIFKHESVEPHAYNNDGDVTCAQ